MSDLSVIGMTTGIFIAAYFVAVRHDKHIHERGDAIITGTIGGVPTSVKNRWVMLFQHWMPNVAGAIIFGLIVALANIGIARNTNDELVQGLAYSCAFGAGFVAVFWLVLGPFYFFYLTALLRRAAADEEA